MSGFVSAANLGGVADPRMSADVDAIGTRRDSTILHPAPPDADRNHSIFLDSSITFEAYHFWANRAREAEKFLVTEGTIKQISKIAFKKPGDHPPHQAEENSSDEKEKAADPSAIVATDSNGAGDGYGVTETEWERAQRATRTATWITIFYLITTDILGPYTVPWAISTMGYGPGITLYIVFGALAFYSGLQLWKQFLGLDSPRYPMRNYGDLGFRLFGNWARVIINVLQSCQFFLNVSLLIESNGQGLQQMAAGKNGTGVLCFVVAELIFMLVGFVLGQIRTLQRLGFLANLAIWLNVFVIFMTMGVVPAYGPNEIASHAAYNTTIGEPVMTSAYWPEGSTLRDHLNGVTNLIFAYGGATLFNELMAEMRRPMDFWKGFICAEIFIFAVYMTIGTVVYSYQGQYTYNPAYQGIPNSAYAWQTVGNAITFISGIIAALLYGNIGIKVLYAAILRDVFKFPPLDAKKGKWTFALVVPIYWGLAFVIAAAIPQISYLTSFVGAAFILQFSYTFPPILMVAFNVQKDAILPEETFDPISGQANRVDSGIKRWIRGYRKKFFRNTFDVLYFLASLATAGLGIWAAIIAMHETFTAPGSNLTPFTCNSPTG